MPPPPLPTTLPPPQSWQSPSPPNSDDALFPFRDTSAASDLLHRPPPCASQPPSLISSSNCRAIPHPDGSAPILFHYQPPCPPPQPISLTDLRLLPRPQSPPPSTTPRPPEHSLDLLSLPAHRKPSTVSVSALSSPQTTDPKHEPNPFSADLVLKRTASASSAISSSTLLVALLGGGFGREV